MQRLFVEISAYQFDGYYEILDIAGDLRLHLSDENHDLSMYWGQNFESSSRDNRTCGPTICYVMMTSSNGNIFRITDHLYGEFTSDWWIPHTKASDAELWC